RNKHAHFPPQQLKQDRDAPIVGNALDDAAGVLENAVDQSNPAADADAGRKTKLDDAIVAFAGANFIDHTGGKRQWLLAREHEVAHAECRLNRAPAVAREIEGDEHVAGKQRPHDGLGLAGVAARALVARQIGREPLPLQIHFRPPFVVGLRVNDVPPCGAERHAAAPVSVDASRAGNRSNAGAYTCSAPNAATAASNASRGCTRAVTTMASTRPSAAIASVSGPVSGPSAMTRTISTG